MTRYAGGKNRIGASIAQQLCAIEKCFAEPGTLNYFEPMCGMLGVFRHMVETRVPPAKAIACDGNKQVATMWQVLKERWQTDKQELKRQDGDFLDPRVTMEEFNDFKRRLTLQDEANKLKRDNASPQEIAEFKQKITNKDDLLALTKEQSARCGVMGHACSFGGNYFSGWVGKYGDKTGEQYMRCAAKNFADVLPKVCKGEFMNGTDYKNHKPIGALVYMDPPYAKGQKNCSNKAFRYFNHTVFWQDMTKWAQDNIVVVSEESAPQDWIPVYGKPYTRTSNHWLKNRPEDTVTKKETTEVLFMHKSQAYIYLDSLAKGPAPPPLKAKLSPKAAKIAAAEFHQRSMDDATRMFQSISLQPKAAKAKKPAPALYYPPPIHYYT